MLSEVVALEFHFENSFYQRMSWINSIKHHLKLIALGCLQLYPHLGFSSTHLAVNSWLLRGLCLWSLHRALWALIRYWGTSKLIWFKGTIYWCCLCVYWRAQTKTWWCRDNGHSCKSGEWKMCNPIAFDHMIQSGLPYWFALLEVYERRTHSSTRLS